MTQPSFTKSIAFGCIALGIAFSSPSFSAPSSAPSMNHLSKNTDTATESPRTLVEAISDATLSTTIKTRLFTSELQATKIKVTTHRGHVTLLGKVKSKAHADLATTITEDVKGVMQVTNHLTVKELVARR